MANPSPQPARTPGKPRPKIKLRPAVFDDYEQIAVLQSRFRLDPGTRAEWIHLWDANPLYQQLRHGWNIGWVVEDASRRIVASVGNIPLAYELGGRKIVAATGRALVAEPEFRGSTPLLLDRVIHQPGVDLYLNNTVGPASESVLTPFECRRVPVGAWDRVAFWVTNPQPFLERVTRPRLKAFAKPLSYPLAAAAVLWDKCLHATWRAGDMEVSFASGFDQRFDVFWEDLRRRYADRLLAVRTRAILEWHFHRAIQAGSIWIATAGRGSGMIAYAVFDRSDNHTLGFSRMRLIDFQTVENGSDAFLCVLAGALKRCRQEGIHMLELIGSGLEKGELVARIAPCQRRLPVWTYYYRINNTDRAERLADPGVWDPTLFDGDASF